MIARQPRVVEVNARPDRRQLTYIQHSLVFRFPDIITVEFVPFGPDRSSIALYSRSLASPFYAGFGPNNRHQPAGEIVPSTSLQEEGGSKLTHLLQDCPSLGKVWYCTVFCGTFCAGAGAC
jgi:hypothetical protein